MEDNDVETQSNSPGRSSQNTGNGGFPSNSIIKQEVLDDVTDSQETFDDVIDAQEVLDDVNDSQRALLDRGVKSEVGFRGMMDNSASQEMTFGLDERLIKQEAL